MGLRYKKAHVTHPELKGALRLTYNRKIILYVLYLRPELLNLNRIN